MAGWWRWRLGLFALLCVALPHHAVAQKKSLVIGVDGLGFGSMGLDVADTPFLDSLIAGEFGGGAYHAAYTDNAFAGGELGQATEQPTVSGPGWSTILTGVWADRHHVTNNSFTSPDYANNPVYLATLKAAIPTLTTASFINWTPIDTHIIQSVDSDADSANNLDYRVAGLSDAAVAADVVGKLTDVNGLDPDAIFIHFDEVDGAGHSCGNLGVCYRDEIEDTDRLIGLVLAAVEGRPNFAAEDWQIIVTSDHGHVPTGGHGGQSDLERQIPFLVASKSAAQGDLLPFPSAISHADVAPTVLDHFGLAIPDNYFGDARGGLVGALGDLNQDGLVDLGDWAHFSSVQGVDLADLSPMDRYLNGDLNADGSHSLADAIAFRQYYVAAGGSASELVEAAVPEPTGVALLSAGLALAPIRPQRR